MISSPINYFNLQLQDDRVRTKMVCEIDSTLLLSSQRSLPSGEQGNLHSSSYRPGVAERQVGGQSCHERGQVCPAVHPVFSRVYCGEVPHVCCCLDPLWHTSYQPKPRNRHLHSLQSLV